MLKERDGLLKTYEGWLELGDFDAWWAELGFRPEKPLAEADARALVAAAELAGSPGGPPAATATARSGGCLRRWCARRARATWRAAGAA